MISRAACQADRGHLAEAVDRCLAPAPARLGDARRAELPQKGPLGALLALGEQLPLVGRDERPSREQRCPDQAHRLGALP